MKLKPKAVYLESHPTDMEKLALEARSFYPKFIRRPFYPTLSLAMEWVSTVSFTFQGSTDTAQSSGYSSCLLVAEWTCLQACSPVHWLILRLTGGTWAVSRQCLQLLFLFASLLVNSFFHRCVRRWWPKPRLTPTEFYCHRPGH